MKWLAKLVSKKMVQQELLHTQEMIKVSDKMGRLTSVIEGLKDANKRLAQEINAQEGEINRYKEENEKLTRRCISYMKAFDVQMGMHELMMEEKK